MEKLTYLPPELNNIIKQFYVGDYDFICKFIQLMAKHIEKEYRPHNPGPKIKKALNQNKHSYFTIQTKKGWYAIQVIDEKIIILSEEVMTAQKYKKSSIAQHGFTIATIDNKFTQMVENKCDFYEEAIDFVKKIKDAFIKVQKYKFKVESLFS